MPVSAQQVNYVLLAVLMCYVAVNDDRSCRKTIVIQSFATLYIKEKHSGCYSLTYVILDIRHVHYLQQ